MDLTVEDINLILEALNELKSKGVAGSLFGMMVAGMLADDEQEREAQIQRGSKELEEIKESNKARSESIVLIEAKLIQYKRELITHEEWDEIRGG